MNIIEQLRESEARGQSVAGNPELKRHVCAPSPISELDWLHSAELCSEVLRLEGGTEIPLDRRRELLGLWIKLGRPHPAILRRILLRVDRNYRAYDISGVSESDIEELVNWSHESWIRFYMSRYAPKPGLTGMWTEGRHTWHEPYEPDNPECRTSVTTIAPGPFVSTRPGFSESMEIKIGPLPISECYFVGAKHEGGFSGHGIISILHLPTNDIWLLSPFGDGSRDLCLTRIINGQKIPPQWESQVKALRDAAHRNWGVEDLMRMPSEIGVSDSVQQWERYGTPEGQAKYRSLDELAKRLRSTSSD